MILLAAPYGERVRLHVLWFFVRECAFFSCPILGVCFFYLKMKGSMVDFVHITKTGGTTTLQSILNANKKSACPSFKHIKQLDGSHQPTAKDILTRGKTPVTIIREPVERFESMVSYHLYGSEKYKRGKGFADNNIRNVPDFVDCLKFPESECHAMAKKNQQGFGFTWSQHFAPQTDWITKGCPECDKGTIFICNDGDLNRAVKDAFDKHGIDCNVDIKHLNVTKYNKDENQLSDEQKEWIRDLFSGDVEMWKRHCE